jgi:GT2 family glycosyltransferase
MKVSIVIPNFNGEELLKKNLPEVLGVIGDTELIIVDDASEDKSVEYIKNQTSKIKNIKLIKNAKNLGFSSTVNIGVQEATGELVVLLNTDVIPEKDFLDSAIRHFEDQKVFAVGFLQKCSENGKIILRGRGVGKFERGFLVHSRGNISDKDTSDGVDMHFSEVEDFRKTLWVSGGAGIFRKSIWSKLGGLNTLYNPFYWEDLDFSYRALKRGYKLIFEPKSIVHHLQKESVIKSSYTAKQIKKMAYRNQLFFVWLNITDWVLILQHILYLPYYLLKSLLIFDWPFIEALFQAILIFPRILISRYQNSKSFTLTDGEVLENLSI